MVDSVDRRFFGRMFSVAVYTALCMSVGGNFHLYVILLSLMLLGCISTVVYASGLTGRCAHECLLGSFVTLLLALPIPLPPLLVVFHRVLCAFMLDDAIWGTILMYRFLSKKKKRKPPVEPTPAQIASACMSFDHGFGLLPKEEQAQMMRDAREWKIAWDKEEE